MSANEPAEAPQPRRLRERPAAEEEPAPKRANTRQALTRDECMELEAMCKDQRGVRQLEFNFAVLYVQVYARLTREKLEAKVKAGKKKVPAAFNYRPQARACEVLRISASTLTKSLEWVREYMDTVKREGEAAGLDVASRTGLRGRQKKKTRVPDTDEVVVLVRRFVREKRAQGARVTCKQVLDMLVEKRHVSIPIVRIHGRHMRDKVKEASALRAVLRWTKKHGYVRTKKKGGYLAEREEIQEWRDDYIKGHLANRSLPLNEQFRELYTDESYQHQYDNRSEGGLRDESDLNDKAYKRPGKGRRFCFCDAIVGPRPDRPRGERSGEPLDRGGPVPGAWWIFCPQRKDPNSSFHKGDYHKTFKWKNFGDWYVKLLRLLKEHYPGQRFRIYLDNAKYHKHREGRPELKRKADVIKYLDENNIEYPKSGDGFRVKELRARARMWFNQNTKHEVERLAEADGHKVVWTPPHHSDLQPIEIYWADIKGYSASRFHKGTSLDDIKHLLEERRKEIMDEYEKGPARDDGRTTVEALVDKTHRLTVELEKEIIRLRELERNNESAAQKQLQEEERVLKLAEEERDVAASRKAEAAEAESSEDEWDSDESDDSGESDSEGYGSDAGMFGM